MGGFVILSVSVGVNMIKIGQLVKVVSCSNTAFFCGRKSKYDIGSSLVVVDISNNPRGHGKILSDDDYNFIHEDDVKYEFEVSK